MATKACFHMGNCETGLGTPESRAKRARRVALHDDQPRLIQGCPDGSRDIAHVKLRVRPAGAAKLDRRDRRHAVVRWLKVGMLSGEDEARADAAMEERFG